MVMPSRNFMFLMLTVFWAYLMEKGFHPDSPQDASWANVTSICPILAVGPSKHVPVFVSCRIAEKLFEHRRL